MTTESSHDALRRVVDIANQNQSEDQLASVVAKTRVRGEVIGSWSPLVEEHCNQEVVAQQVRI